MLVFIHLLSGLNVATCCPLQLSLPVRCHLHVWQPSDNSRFTCTMAVRCHLHVWQTSDNSRFTCTMASRNPHFIARNSNHAAAACAREMHATCDCSPMRPQNASTECFGLQHKPEMPQSLRSDEVLPAELTDAASGIILHDKSAAMQGLVIPGNTPPCHAAVNRRQTS